MKKLGDIDRSQNPYDINSRERLKVNMERKFKKLFGAALYHFETLLAKEIQLNPELHKEYRTELLRIGNRMIQNMKKELDCYNIQYIPFKIELRMDDDNG